MNHYYWTYVGGAGRNTKVGLYHSGTTGHLLIYVGKKIVAVDFRVFESKEYPFFIDEELCRIKLERRGDEMFFFFEIDKKTDTPMNRARWALERRHLRQMLVVLGIAGALAAAFFFWAQRQDSGQHAERLLASRGVSTAGKVAFGKNGSKADLYYYYVDGGTGRTGLLKDWAQMAKIVQMPMPLEPGDEFEVRHVPGQAGPNRIYLNRPTGHQLEVYRQRAARAYLDNHPGTPQPTVDCLLDLATDLGGLDGLADFYFQKTPPSENPRHNSETYAQLVNGYLFTGKRKAACPVE